jgi:photosystem II stability/assembly factor-like uncharacterized protein
VVGNGGIILKTTNGGDDWFNLQSGTNYDIRAVSFPEENIGYIIYSKYVAKTINGGESWTVLKDFPGDLLYAMCFSDNSHGTILTIYQYGQTSKILRTNDGGNSWIEQNSGVYAYLFGVDFVDALNGIIVGMNGLTIRTTDGGYTWINRVSGTSKILEDVSYTETNSATAVGYEGTILHSSNGGNRWTNQVSNTGRRLMAVSFADSNNGTAVGENGTILHTTSGGITFLEVYEELPKEFSLSQNYPNPFNPVTKIKYSIPQSSKVVIKVFDILGNEIETLVNEEKPAGTYEITWFAEGLPSGIYFYQLKTGKYVETKKMLLMK